MGVSGNPSGKRKEKLFFDALMLAIKDQADKRGLRLIAEKLLDLAVSGDMQAIKEVANRLDGMPVQAIDQTIEQTHYVARLPDPIGTTEEWKNRYSKSSGSPSQDRKPH